MFILGLEGEDGKRGPRNLQIFLCFYNLNVSCQQSWTSKYILQQQKKIISKQRIIKTCSLINSHPFRQSKITNFLKLEFRNLDRLFSKRLACKIQIFTNRNYHFQITKDENFPAAERFFLHFNSNQKYLVVQLNYKNLDEDMLRKRVKFNKESFMYTLKKIVGIYNIANINVSLTYICIH